MQRLLRRRWSSAGAWHLPFLLALTTFVLLPALKTGYWAEDLCHSVTIPGTVVLDGQGLFSQVGAHVRYTIESGRFFPLTPILITVVFVLIHDVVVYKAYIIAITLIDVILFYVLIRKLSGRAGFACFAACSVISLFQFRVFVDPFLAYYGQIQWVTAGLFLSLYSLQSFLERGKKVGLFASVLAYLACALAYEVSYALIPLHGLLIVRARRGWGTRLKLGLPFLGIVAFCGLASFAVRRLYPSDFYVHRTNLDPGAILRTLVHQTTAALPLSYYLTDPHGLFAGMRDPSALVSTLGQTRVIAVALAALVLAYAGVRLGRREAEAEAEAGSSPPGGPGLMVGLGLMLAVLPTLLISISPHHQSYLAPGVGWIMVMIQYYGVGLLLATAIWQALERPSGQGAFSHRKGFVAASLIAGLMGLTYRVNGEVALSFSAPPASDRYREIAGRHGASWHHHRLNLESALRSGLLEGIPEGSVVQMANLYPYWHDPIYGRFFYATNARKAFAVIPATPPTAASSGVAPFRVRDVPLGPGAGFVVLSQFGGPRESPAAPDDARGLRLFVRKPDLFREGSVPAFLLVGRPPRSGSGEGSQSLAWLARDLPLIGSGRDWAVYSLRPTSPVDPDTLRLVFNAAKATPRRRVSRRPELAIREHARAVQ